MNLFSDFEVLKTNPAARSPSEEHKPLPAEHKAETTAVPATISDSTKSSDRTEAEVNLPDVSMKHDEAIKGSEDGAKEVGKVYYC